MLLYEAILEGKKDEIRRLLASGADVNEIDIYGFTPLIEAAIMNHVDIAAWLIERGADVNKKDLTGGSALHWAVDNNSLPMCELLLKVKADPNAYTRYGQPILALPILRRAEAIKTVLCRHGGSLAFAQDYINTKLIGHRFELVGKVDIVTPKNVFIEIDFEGFIPEFTISVIQDSLTRFKNNFSAKSLQEHFDALQGVINAFSVAMRLLRYQHHLSKAKQAESKITELMSQPCVLFPVGYAGHAISFAKHNWFLAKCDRGENSLRHPSVEIFRMTRKERYNLNFVHRLLYQRQSLEYVTDGIMQDLGLETITDLPLPSQLTGNCSWANTEAAVPTLLLLQWLDKTHDQISKNLSAYKEQALSIYTQWLEWDRNFALHQCVTSFYESNPARKASKAAVLAAVLFQTCHYAAPEDIDRANKILKVLAVPEYGHVLKSYLEVYGNTKAGQNLRELIDLYK